MPLKKNQAEMRLTRSEQAYVFIVKSAVGKIYYACPRLIVENLIARKRVYCDFSLVVNEHRDQA